MYDWCIATVEKPKLYNDYFMDDLLQNFNKSACLYELFEYLAHAHGQKGKEQIHN